MTRPMLEGLRVVAVSQFGAGPFGTQLLADLGAEVIKIEDPAVGGDVSRQVGPYAGDGDSLYFQSFNRGSKSLTLNLQHEAGRAVLHDLVKVSDALFNNVRGDLPVRRAGGRPVRLTALAAAARYGTSSPPARRPRYELHPNRLAEGGHNGSSQWLDTVIIRSSSIG